MMMQNGRRIDEKKNDRKSFDAKRHFLNLLESKVSNIYSEMLSQIYT